MFNQFLNKVSDLHQKKEAFAIAFVINRQLPSSGKPGDRAVIEKDGTLSGWIGGGCTRGIVIKEALLAIESGKPRIVNISPKGEVRAKTGVMDYKMTCHSGGAVEVYIEAVLPKPHLLILGKSHVAMSLSRIAKAMDYQLSVLAKSADEIAFPDADLIQEEDAEMKMVQPNSYIVVCTQGENDEQALAYALRSDASYISFIASRKKANAIFRNLRQMDFSFDDLKRIKTPAGLNINAKLPEEVAISILAEIIAHIRKEEPEEQNASRHQLPVTNSNPNLFINPVCGIPVDKKTAKHIIDYEGEKYYFCCDGCKVTFEKEPAKYALAN